MSLTCQCRRQSSLSRVARSLNLLLCSGHSSHRIPSHLQSPHRLAGFHLVTLLSSPLSLTSGRVKRRASKSHISRTPSSLISPTSPYNPNHANALFVSVVTGGNTTHRAPLGHPHHHRLTHNTQRRAGYRPPRGPALSRRGARHFTFNARPAPFSTRTQSSSFQTGRSILPHWILHHKGRFRRV